MPGNSVDEAGWLAAGASVVVGALTSAATYFAGRRQEKASIVRAIQDAAHIAIQDLKGLCDVLRAELAHARQEIDELKGVRDEFAQAHSRCEADLAHLRGQLERLLGEPIPPCPADEAAASRGAGI